MANKTLQIIEAAYRGTIEEQDDTIVWLTHAMKGQGADLDVLLEGNAVNYAVKGQDASGLQFGAKKQTQPPRLMDDVAKLTEKGITVYIVEDDVRSRGIEDGDLIEGLRPIARSEIASLFARYDRVWHW
jgi:sulfur relay (sulfurtransferase) DsrF/TusC family protein